MTEHQQQLSEILHTTLLELVPDNINAAGEKWLETLFRKLLARQADATSFLERLGSRLDEESFANIRLLDQPSDRPALLELTPSDLVNRFAHSAPRAIGGPGPAVSANSSNATVVRIFYATDRQAVPDPQLSTNFYAQRSPGGELNFGECEVSIPAIHKIGRLESPSILRLEFRPDPTRHIVLAQVNSLAEETFLARVSEAVAASAAKDAFLFVHGYNVTFEDAARRTGQFAFDLHFVGAPILYSWPANGRVFDYAADEANAIWTAPHLERFLALIAARSGAERIHVIAHSMGNRAVCDALKTLSYRKPSTAGLLLQHLVLAAPDIDADTFRELAAAIKAMSGRVTLYESSKDKALLLSKRLHQNPRAGEPLLIVADVDTIDASEMHTDFLAHSYFSESWPLLSDIHTLISTDTPPSGRFGLQATNDAAGLYYVFRP